MVRPAVLIMTALAGLCFIAIPKARAEAPAVPLPPVFAHPIDVDAPPSGFTESTTQMQEIAAMSGKFTQEKTIRALARPLRSSGEFYFEDERGLCWKTMSPFVSTVVISKDGVEQFAEDGSREEPFTANREVLQGFSAIFLGAFAGETTQLAETFAIHFAKEGAGWRIGFLPKGGQAARFLSYIVLGGTTQVDRLEIRSIKGDTTIITFHDARPAAALTAAELRCFSPQTSNSQR